MMTAAKRALRWKEEGKAKGAGTPIGWGRATDIVNGSTMSLSTVKRMYSFFSRHEVDKKGKDFDNTSDPSNGRIMWDAWGGDAGFTWSKTIVEREKKKLEKHMEGKHDQSTHAGGKGKAPSIDNPQEWIRTKPLNADAIWDSENDQIAHHQFQRQMDFYGGSFIFGDKATDYATAMTEYTSAGYFYMNVDAREGNPNSYVDDLDQLIEQAPPLPHDFFAYRGIGAGKFAEQVKKLPVGSIIEDKGFLSVTPDYDVAQAFSYQVGSSGISDFSQQGGVLMRVMIPKGTKGIDVLGWDFNVDANYFQDYSVGEEEFILPRNTKLQVVESMNNSVTVMVVND
jgi:hypothetical protein